MFSFVVAVQLTLGCRKHLSEGLQDRVLLAPVLWVLAVRMISPPYLSTLFELKSA